VVNTFKFNFETQRLVCTYLTQTWFETTQHLLFTVEWFGV